MGINAQLDAPGRFQAKGLGSSDTPGCPTDTWCVKNAGSYRGSDERHRRAGHLAEHRVRQADLAGRGAALRGHGGQAGPAVVRAAGHRPRLRPARATRAWPTSSSGRTSARSRWARSSSTRWSFATSPPRWRPAACGARPTRSTRSSTAHGKEVAVTTETCEQVVPEGLANTLANAMSKDDQGAGTAAGCGRLGGLGPADVGQDRHHRGAPLVGVPRVHQLAAPRPTTSTTTRRRRATCARSRCASAARATCSAATSPPGPGSPR